MKQLKTLRPTVSFDCFSAIITSGSRHLFIVQFTIHMFIVLKVGRSVEWNFAFEATSRSGIKSNPFKQILSKDAYQIKCSV